jgi:hypothetical protein
LSGAKGSSQVSGSPDTYLNALPGVDVEYSAAPDQVKEGLVLKNASSTETFDFNVQMNSGHSPRYRRE